VQDLSHLIKPGWPAYNASMAAGGTIDNIAPEGKAPGTPSEQTELAAQGVDVQGKVSPNLSVSPNSDDSAVNTKSRFNHDYSPSEPTWKTVK